MSVEKGQLSIHTENFLPIIKKWLYSDRDIFVRELVSNCCDAVAKRRMTGETPEDYSPRVTVRVDKEHRILSFTDDGVGMTAEEVRKYINQVAFSGANDFLEKYKDKLVMRTQEMSNHPEIVRRLGIIGINTALEFDIYGNVNSTHVGGTRMMNGIGGSGEVERL